MTTIIAKKDLYNGGKCFTKGKEYKIKFSRPITVEATLMDAHVINDLGQDHVIGGWWREFKISKTNNNEY